MPQTTAVLLVDDSAEYLDAMELNLPSGCRPVRASTVEGARALIETDPPAVAIVDIRLKEAEHQNRDGLELLNWLHVRHPEIPVIMISAYQEFEFETESLALGAEFFLKKPIQPDQFQHAVAKLLRRPQ